MYQSNTLHSSLNQNLFPQAPPIQGYSLPKADRVTINRKKNKSKSKDMSQKQNQSQNANHFQEQDQLRLDVCPRHRLQITNISVSEHLIEPLCPECIEEHVLLLQNMNITPCIKNISQVRQHCLNFLKGLRTQYTEQYQILNQFSQENLQQTINRQQSIIVQARNQAIAYIDSYFDNLQVSISQNITQHSQKNPQEIQQLQSKLNELLQEVDRKDQKLNGQFYMKTLLKMLQKEQENTYNLNCFNVQAELVKLEKGLKAVVVDTDQAVFKNLLPTLQSYVKIDDATKFIKKDHFSFRILPKETQPQNKSNFNSNFQNIMSKYNQQKNLAQLNQIYPEDTPQKFKHNLDHLQIQMDPPKDTPAEQDLRPKKLQQLNKKSFMK